MSHIIILVDTFNIYIKTYNIMTEFDIKKSSKMSNYKSRNYIFLTHIKFIKFVNIIYIYEIYVRNAIDYFKTLLK